MTSHLAVNALEMAIARRGRDQVPSCVVHADRGPKFRSRPSLALTTLGVGIVLAGIASLAAAVA